MTHQKWIFRDRKIKNSNVDLNQLKVSLWNQQIGEGKTTWEAKEKVSSCTDEEEEEEKEEKTKAATVWLQSDADKDADIENEAEDEELSCHFEVEMQ